MQRPLIFCLTPVKNEAWILELFLKCASVWADRIIIADQGSTDGSREIAQKFPKVTIIDNTSHEFKEVERQRMLIKEARRTEDPKVLLALDADEFLTANFLTSPEWESIISAAPGTVIRLQRPEIQANVSELSFFYFPGDLPVGFVDDGSEHEGKVIHSFRIPVPPRCPILAPTEIKLMHYSLFDVDRFKSRIRWYQCFEHLTLNKTPIDLYRYYNWPLFLSSNVIKPVPKEWINGYEERGIDMSSVNRDGCYRWDREVLRYFEQYGTARFRRLAVWDVNWNQIYSAFYSKEAAQSFADPRSPAEKLVHGWLKRTQPSWSPDSRARCGRKLVHRCIHRGLRLMGW